MARKFMSTQRIKRIHLTREWANEFPKEAGVYIFFNGDQICYVGETGSIRARMKDLLDTRNHVIRRNIGNTKFKGTTGFRKATASKKFVKIIEIKLNKWIERNLKVSTLVVDLGRKELEEYLYAKYKPKYNKKGKRAG